MHTFTGCNKLLCTVRYRVHAATTDPGSEGLKDSYAVVSNQWSVSRQRTLVACSITRSNEDRCSSALFDSASEGWCTAMSGPVHTTRMHGVRKDGGRKEGGRRRASREGRRGISRERERETSIHLAEPYNCWNCRFRMNSSLQLRRL